TGTGSITQQGGTRTVLAPLGLNMRDQPSGKVIGSLGEGSVVTVLGHTDQAGGWYQVRGASLTGHITADARHSSPRTLPAYGSSQHGFSLLSPDDWNFSDDPAGIVTFAPVQGAALRLRVLAAPTVQALGQAGRAGYAVASGDTIEVFGVTGTLRVYDRGQ